MEAIYYTLLQSVQERDPYLPFPPQCCRLIMGDVFEQHLVLWSEVRELIKISPRYQPRACIPADRPLVKTLGTLFQSVRCS